MLCYAIRVTLWRSKGPGVQNSGSKVHVFLPVLKSGQFSWGRRDNLEGKRKARSPELRSPHRPPLSPPSPPPTPRLQLHFSCHHLCTMCAMRYELVECNQFQANTFLYFNLGYEIKNGTQLCSKIDQNMFNAYSDKCTRKRVKVGDVKK